MSLDVHGNKVTSNNYERNICIHEIWMILCSSVFFLVHLLMNFSWSLKLHSAWVWMWRSMNSIKCCLMSSGLELHLTHTSKASWQRGSSNFKLTFVSWQEVSAAFSLHRLSPLQWGESAFHSFSISHLFLHSPQINMLLGKCFLV